MGAVLLLSTGASAVAAMRQGGTTPDGFTRIRTLDPVIGAAFERGVRESPTFAQLVDNLDASDVIVYIARERCAGPRVVGCIASISRHGGVRYVRVHLVFLREATETALARSADRLVAQIGHEMQHALEIAGDRSIVDMRTLERAYGRSGAYKHTVGFETDAALEMGERVLKELQRHRR